MKEKKNFLEKPGMVFLYVPEIEKICIEYGIDRNDAKTITAMYEVFKRSTNVSKIVMQEEDYDDGYKEGWNDAMMKAEEMIDGLYWEIGKLKKN